MMKSLLQVEKLRRNLLRLIGVGEFASVSEWEDPCASYILPQMPCEACGSCRDVDLCKTYDVSRSKRCFD